MFYPFLSEISLHKSLHKIVMVTDSCSCSRKFFKFFISFRRLTSQLLSVLLALVIGQLLPVFTPLLQHFVRIACVRQQFQLVSCQDLLLTFYNDRSRQQVLSSRCLSSCWCLLPSQYGLVIIFSLSYVPIFYPNSRSVSVWPGWYYFIIVSPQFYPNLSYLIANFDIILLGIV